MIVWAVCIHHGTPWYIRPGNPLSIEGTAQMHELGTNLANSSLLNGHRPEVFCMESRAAQESAIILAGYLQSPLVRFDAHLSGKNETQAVQLGYSLITDIGRSGAVAIVLVTDTIQTDGLLRFFNAGKPLRELYGMLKIPHGQGFAYNHLTERCYMLPLLHRKQRQ